MSKSVAVTYVGPHDEVWVPLPNGASVTCKRGESVEVPAEVANGTETRSGLLEQTDAWQAAKASPKSPNKAGEPAEEVDR